MKYNSLNVFDARPYSVQKLKFGASTLTTGKILSCDVSRCVDRYNKVINIRAPNRFNSSYGVEIRHPCACFWKTSKGEYNPITESGAGRGLPRTKFFICIKIIFLSLRTGQSEDFFALNFLYVWNIMLSHFA